MIVFVAALAVSFTACQNKEIKTITSTRVEKIEKSWDGNSNNSGIIDFVDGKGFLITKKAAERYNTLISIYGKNELPPILKNYEILNEDSKIYLTSEGMTIFIVFSDKFNNGDKE